MQEHLGAPKSGFYCFFGFLHYNFLKFTYMIGDNYNIVMVFLPHINKNRP